MKSIEELLNNDEISVRSFNLCGYNDLMNTQDITKHFLNKGTFLNLRNCGRKSNDELINVAEQYLESIGEENLNKKGETGNLFDYTSELSEIKMDIFNNYLSYYLENTTARSRNVFDKNFGTSNKRLNFFLKTSDFLTLENSGSSTVLELKSIKAKLLNDIENIKNISDEDVNSFFNTSYLKSKFPTLEIEENIANSKILIADHFLKNPYIFNDNEIEIIKNNLTIFDNKKHTLEKTADFLNLSRERVRQIRNKIINTLKEKLNFIINIKDDYFEINNYSLNYLILSDKNQEITNRKFNTIFTKPFYTFLFFINNYNFEIIGNIEDAFVERDFTKRNSHQWKNIYLLRKELLSEIRVENLIDTLFLKSKSKIDNQEFINLEDYINETCPYKQILLQFLKKITLEEFEFEQQDNFIIVPRNTRKNAHEYSYESLKILGKPSSVSEIFIKIKELYPDFDITESGVRASMRRLFGFVPIGRSSNFGLKEWEETMEFKGGTLREIIREYLENLDAPQKIDDILEYIRKFRKTSRNSLNSNLKLDKSDTFRFFEKSFIGLKDKEYSNEFTELNMESIIKKTWEESFEILSDFLTANNRLPQSDSENKEESIIYRWLNVQKQKFYKNILTTERFLLLNNLLLQINPNYFKINNNKILKKLLDFVLENNRLPVENEELINAYNQLETEYMDFSIGNNELKYLRKIRCLIKE